MNPANSNNSNESNNKHDGQAKDHNKLSSYKILETTFLATVASASIVFGFGMTLAMAKKKDPSMFTKGLIGNSREVPESGSRLAMRALGWGTLYSVTGFSVLCYAVWKLMGVQNLQEFRMKAGSFLPRIPKNEPQGRTEFESLRDLLTYLSEDGGKK